jgi:hypothetical protein
LTTSDIQDELSSIPGVAEVEVTLLDGEPPHARVWLDGSRPDQEVQERIDALLGGAVPDLVTEPLPPSRRGGLGKGLDSLMPDADGDAIPSQFRGQLETRGASIERVAVVEHIAGVSVEIEDGAGHTFSVDVDESGSIDNAVIAAVRSMTGAPDDVTFHLGSTEVDSVPVVVVTAMRGLRTVAGASVITFGRPYALAKAVRQAVASL